MSDKCTAANTQAFSSTEQDLQNERDFAAMAKALSHPARVRILKILLTLDKLGGCLNSDLVSELNLAQSTVSEHLRILKTTGFIFAEPIPPKMCYRVNRDKLTEFEGLLSGILH